MQITTGTASHLDPYTAQDALHAMSLDGVDILFIENVGNLVCPANFDLGQHRNGILLSVTKGDDKPTKYPVMFRAADLLLITKTDLLPVLDDFSTVRANSACAIWQALRRCSSCRRASTLASRRGCSGRAANFQRNVYAAPLPPGSCGLRHGNHASWVVGTSARCPYNGRVGTQTQK